MSKKVYLKSFGCQMNEFDSEVAAGELAVRLKGCRFVESEDEADIILFNTCSVRQHAEDRVFGRLASLKSLKVERPQIVIGVMGCMAERYKEELFQRFPHLDFVCSPRQTLEISKLVTAVLEKRKKEKALGQNGIPQKLAVRACRRHRIKAWLAIMEGCDNFCSYCVVPFVRGREVSYPSSQILEKLRQLAGEGVKQVTLLGQNVNSYRKGLSEKIDFPELLRRASRVDGIEMISFMTSHPHDASDELFRVIRDTPKISRHFHLPLQSGSNRILGRMNRRYTIEEYEKKVERLRRCVPDAAVTTDVIVGFPGEAEKDFQETVRAMERIRFRNAYLFKYSPRPGTHACAWPDDVPKSEKERRHTFLLKLQERLMKAVNQSQVGRVCNVLFEGESKRSSGELLGETWAEQTVVARGPRTWIGTVRTAEIVAANHEVLRGRVVEGRP